MNTHRDEEEPANNNNVPRVRENLITESVYSKLELNK